jgi:hypothetical protein
MFLTMHRLWLVKIHLVARNRKRKGYLTTVLWEFWLYSRLSISHVLSRTQAILSPTTHRQLHQVIHERLQTHIIRKDRLRRL